MERVRRIELRCSGWRPDAQPIGDTRQNLGADGDNRNLFSGLEAQGTAYIPRPLTYTSVMLIQLSKSALTYTSTASLSTERESDKMPQITDKTKKRAAIFGGRPLLEIGMLFQDG